jgi:hypothetical protein
MTIRNVKTENWAFTAFPIINMKILLRSRGCFILIACVVKRNCQPGCFSDSKQYLNSCKHSALDIILLFLSIFSLSHSALNIRQNPLFIYKMEAFLFVDFLTSLATCFRIKLLLTIKVLSREMFLQVSGYLVWRWFFTR